MGVRLAAVAVVLAAFFLSLMRGLRPEQVTLRRQIRIAIPCFLVSPPVALWFFGLPLPVGAFTGLSVALSFGLLLACAVYIEVRNRRSAARTNQRLERAQ